MSAGLQRVYILTKMADGGYRSIALNIYPYAKGVIVGKLTNGDVVVEFDEWRDNPFIFKEDELIYGD